MSADAVRERAARLVGVITPMFFVALFLIQDRRPGFDPLSQFVSELSIGPLGWVQAATFIITGVGFVAYGLLLRALRPRTRVGPVAYIIVGVGLGASGFFVTDPSTMFAQTTAVGTVHGILGAVVFALFPVICFVFSRDLARRGQRRGARLTLAVGILLVVGIVVLKVSELPGGVLFEEKGLVQRVVLVLFMAWSAVFAATGEGRPARPLRRDWAVNRTRVGTHD